MTYCKHMARTAGLAIVLAALPFAPVAPQNAPPARQAPPPAQRAPQRVQIDRNGVLMLIRSSLLALHHANQTGNYTVLRDLGAPGFQTANTAARLSEIFANLRAQNLDLSGVAVLEPQLTTLPQSDEHGFMRMSGFFPSVPLQVNFELVYAPVEGSWRLFGIALNLGQSGPSAPPPPAEAAKQASPRAAGAAPSQTPARPRPPPGRPAQRSEPMSLQP
jgi:hypothetical protein